MKIGIILLLLMLLFPGRSGAEEQQVWEIVTEDGGHLTDICYEPNMEDVYISADNQRYEIVDISGQQATARLTGSVELPALDWMEAQEALPVSARSRHIGLYCTHSDESYEPSDGFYSTRKRGSIYQIAQALADELSLNGIETTVAQALHHPHDAGAYRRSRQTAVELLKAAAPDCLIDIHRDGIPDPASYAVEIGGTEASKIRLLVGRGNQNAAANKEFALMIKAVADRVYPGLIKDIYMGKGTFNQDLLPRSILFECGTYTLEKERVLTSMPLMADVLQRALYGGVTGSVGRITSDVGQAPGATAGITMGAADNTPAEENTGVGRGFSFLGILLLGGLVGFAMLSVGSIKGGARKAARNLSEMTGGLIGKKPSKDEDPHHS